MQVVNLWYPTPNLNAPYNGFGYLIPSSVSREHNPHDALGILFDSDRETARGRPADLSVRHSPNLDTLPGTKLTVMLGGHRWASLPASEWPSPSEAAEMAKATVERHLGIPASTPGVVAGTKVCRQCIPQHFPGHRRRMASAHAELLSGFRGKLAVAGGSYVAPGVLPSLRSGRDVAMQVAGRGYLADDGREWNMEHVGDTGLGRFLKNEFISVPVAKA